MGIQKNADRTRTVWFQVIYGFIVKGKLGHIIEITIYYLHINMVLY